MTGNQVIPPVGIKSLFHFLIRFENQDFAAIVYMSEWHILSQIGKEIRFVTVSS